MSRVWLAHNVANESWLKKSVELRLKDQWIARWRSNLSAKAICRDSPVYKRKYGFESFLTRLSRNNWIIVTKLRAITNCQ